MRLLPQRSATCHLHRRSTIMQHRLFLLALLSVSSLVYPAEAGLWDWLAGKGSSWSPSAIEYGNGSSSSPFSSGDGNSADQQPLVYNPIIQNGDTGTGGSIGSMVFGGVSTSFGTMGGIAEQINWGSVYKVTIKQSGQKEDCKETITVELLDSKGKTEISTKCKKPGSYSSRSIRNEDDFLLVGSPDEDICMFTTNKDEIYYLIDGKWRKGDFNGDNSNDKELSAEEIAKIKERVKKWQDFFEESKKEKKRLKGLIKDEKNKFYDERDRIKNLKKEEKQSHKEKVKDIYKLKTEERNRHSSEKKKIYKRRSKEGWSDSLDALMREEEEKHDKKMQELDKMRDEEDKRSETVLKNYDIELSEEEAKYQEERNKLEALLKKEEERVSQEIKENIKQGW